MTRIISGAFGGRRLEVPAGAQTRPTSDRVREALFGRLDHQDVLRGARVLDLYAGSGALGLEALSRGASAVTFIDNDRSAVEALRHNISALLAGIAGHATTVLHEPVQRALLRGAAAPSELVLADPPYSLGDDDLADALALLSLHGWLAADALVIVERSSRSPEPRWPGSLESVDERRYGDTRIWWARVVADPAVA